MLKEEIMCWKASLKPEYKDLLYREKELFPAPSLFTMFLIVKLKASPPIN